MTTTIRLRRGTAAQWTLANPVLALAEPGYETDTGLQKIGDGVTPWSTLNYAFNGTPTPDPDLTDPAGPIGLPLAIPVSEAESATSGTIRMPAQAAVGSVAVVAVVGQGSAVTAPTGWVLIGKPVTGGTPTIFCAAYYKVLAAADLTANHTWSGITTGRVSIVGTVWSGVDTTTPLDVPAGLQANSALDDHVIAPTLATSRVQTALISIGFASTVAGSLAVPPGMTRVSNTGGVGYRVILAAEARATAGATDVRTWYTDPLQQVYMGALNIALRPASTAPPPPVAVTPTASFLADPASGIAPLTVSFVDTSGNTPTSWAWNFGDTVSNTATTRNASHTYSNPGTYTATLVATNTAGSSTTTRTITVNAPPNTTSPITLASTSVGGASASATSVAVPVPATTSTQIAIISLGITSTAVTAPGGWTQVGLATDPAPLASGVWYRVGTASATTATFTGITAGRVGGYLQIYDNVNTSTPLDTTAVVTSTGAAASITVPSLTTATAGALLVQAASLMASTSYDLVVPSGMARILGSDPAQGARRHVVASESRATAGATGTRTWSLLPNDTTLQFAVVSFALRPANPSSTPTPPPTTPPSGNLLFEDDFNGTAGTLVDSTKWSYEYNGGTYADTGAGTFNGRNNELQYYTNADSDNASLDGLGNVRIVCRAESFGGRAYTSAMIHTNGKFTFKYGYIEVRAKIPAASGIWPAIWTEGSTGTWPTHGEIDFMEAVNYDAWHNVNAHGGPTHWDAYKGLALARDNAFHVYAARISTGKVEFYLDGTLIHTVTTGNVPAGQTWPYDTYNQFIRMNVAIGGDWPGAPSGADLPATLLVDYVRVYSDIPVVTPPDTTPTGMPASVGTETLNARVVGATADNGAVKVTTNTSGLGTGGQVRLKVGTDTGVSAGLIYTTALTPNAQGDVTHTITGLTRGATYYYRVQMNSTLDASSTVGKISVAPTAPTSFAFDFGSCCNTADSPAFAAIMGRNDPIFIHLGDLWYADGSGTGVDNFRAKFNSQIRATNAGRLFATTASLFTPSDHDIAMINNGVGTLQPAAAATYNQVHREKIPGNLVAATNGVYETFAYGRVRFIKLDTRSMKTDPAAADTSTKTMLGTTQKNWFLNIIATCTEKVLVICSDVPWQATTTAGEDTWGGYNTERVQIGNALKARPIKAVFLTGDMHMLGVSSGTSYGQGFPNYAASPFMQNANSVKGGPWDATYGSGGTNISQYGRVTVTDTGGTTITLRYDGYTNDGVSRLGRTDTFTV